MRVCQGAVQCMAGGSYMGSGQGRKMPCIGPCFCYSRHLAGTVWVVTISREIKIY